MDSTTHEQVVIFYNFSHSPNQTKRTIELAFRPFRFFPIDFISIERKQKKNKFISKFFPFIDSEGHLKSTLHRIRSQFFFFFFYLST